MRYARWLVAMLVFTVPALLSAQRTGGGFSGAPGGSGFHGGPGGNGSHGGANAGSGFRTRLTGPGHFGQGRNNRGRGYGYPGYSPYSAYLPYVDYWGGGGYGWDYSQFPPGDSGEEDSYQQAANGYSSRPNSVVNNPSGPSPRAFEPPKMVDVPQAANAKPANQQPTVFVLSNGQRIESRDYVLSNQLLSVAVGRQRRTIPLSELDLDATVAANQQRGIDLVVPRDHNSLVLSF